MIKNEALYEVIRENIVDGILPRGFSLPKEAKEGGIGFADGAQDGILMYHAGTSELDEAGKVEMAKVMQLISDGNKTLADEAVIAFSKKHYAISTIDAFQRYIIEHQKELRVEQFFQYALNQLLTGTDKECIKYAMAIMELLNIDEKVKKVIRTLGLSNEFTAFAVFCMMNWESGNEEIFEIAKKVSGWGRIHAVRQIQPETKEIKDWLLYEGSNNNILGEYSALVCFEKAEIAQRLKVQLSDKEFKAIAKIMELLTSEQPMPGLSVIDHQDEVLGDFIKQAKNRVLEIEEYEAILNLLEYIKDQEEKNESLMNAYNNILETLACKRVVEAALSYGKGKALAEILGIKYKDEI